MPLMRKTQYTKWREVYKIFKRRKGWLLHKYELF